MGNPVAQVPKVAQLPGDQAALNALGLEDGPKVLPQVRPVTAEQRGPKPERQLGHHLPVAGGFALAQQRGAGLDHAVALIAAGQGNRVVEPVRAIHRHQLGISPVAQRYLEHVQRSIESRRELDVEGVEPERQSIVPVGPVLVGGETVGGKDVSEGWHEKRISLEFFGRLPHNLSRNPRSVPA